LKKIKDRKRKKEEPEKKVEKRDGRGGDEDF
jgi:hypothetical protein